MTAEFLNWTNRNLRVIYAAGFLRSTGAGLTGVLLGVYLSRTGFSASQIGLVITAGLAASAAGTLAVGLCADRLGRRRTLVGLSVLTTVGASLAWSTAWVRIGAHLSLSTRLSFPKRHQLIDGRLPYPGTA